MCQRLGNIEEFRVRNLGNLVLGEVYLVNVLDLAQLCSEVFSSQFLVD